MQRRHGAGEIEPSTFLQSAQTFSRSCKEVAAHIGVVVSNTPSISDAAPSLRKEIQNLTGPLAALIRYIRDPALAEVVFRTGFGEQEEYWGDLNDTLNVADRVLDMVIEILTRVEEDESSPLWKLRKQGKLERKATKLQLLKEEFYCCFLILGVCLKLIKMLGPQVGRTTNEKFNLKEKRY